MNNLQRERKRWLKTIAILFANGQELTAAGEIYAEYVLEDNTPLETALIINNKQNNANSSSPLLFVEIN